MQRSFILSDSNVIATSVAPVSMNAEAPQPDDTVSIPIGMSLAEADKRLIFATLKRVDGVRKRAAEVLGISSKTLYNRLIEYGVETAASAEPGEGDAAASREGDPMRDAPASREGRRSSRDSLRR